MLKIGLAALVLGIIGVTAFFGYNSNKPKIETEDSIGRSAASLQNDKEDNQNEPPLKLKSIGINFEDFKFTKEKLQFNRLFMGYGFFIPASSASPDKKNPQPTFILPIGTPVRSMVDGIVAAMPTLWSGDISIQVTANGKMEKWVYETEHVINPKVNVGDKVKAGQIIAEVSNFDKGAPEGFGAVEIGILHGGNPPEHLCTFAYLDESINEDILKT